MNDFYVNDFIDATTLRSLVRFLTRSYTGGEVLYVFINSIGGCTRSALAMFEILRELSDKRGVEIVTQAMDGCYSAALILYLAGDQRYATQFSTFLIHEVTVEESKTKHAKGYKDTAVELEKETTILYDLIKARTKLTLPAIQKKVKAAPENDWILDVTEAKKVGIVMHDGFCIPEPAPQEEDEDQEEASPETPEVAQKASSAKRSGRHFSASRKGTQR